MGKPTTIKVLGDKTEGEGKPIIVGSKRWVKLLSNSETTSFRFEAREGDYSFTARKEGKGGEYWYAYRKLEGKLKKLYLGKLEELTSERLLLVAKELYKVLISDGEYQAQLPKKSYVNYEPVISHVKGLTQEKQQLQQKLLEEVTRQRDELQAKLEDSYPKDYVTKLEKRLEIAERERNHFDEELCQLHSQHRELQTCMQELQQRQQEETETLSGTVPVPKPEAVPEPETVSVPSTVPLPVLPDLATVMATVRQWLANNQRLKRSSAELIADLLQEIYQIDWIPAQELGARTDKRSKPKASKKSESLGSTPALKTPVQE